MSKSTEWIHAVPVDPLTGSISVPVYQTSTFVQEAPGVHKGFDYGRTNNPTRKVVEDLIAQMEHGQAGFAFATGLAAIDAVIKLLASGDEIVAVDDIYGGAYRLFTHVYRKFGINVKYVDTTDVGNVENALSPNTKLVWIESPTNPTLKVSDIETIARLTHQVGALLVVDNTFASPVAQNPLLLGADIVVHSATKYLGGHSDLLAGLVVVKSVELAERIKFIQNASGGILAPWDAFLLIRGIETLEIRYRQQSQTAAEVAAFLAGHPKVEKVFYPGLKAHKNHEVAKKQQNGCFGAMVSFTLKNDTSEAAESVVTKTRYFKLAESLGGVKSLVSLSAKMTHASIPREKRLQSGIKDSLIRLSCGLESSQDLIDDLSNALSEL